MLSFSRGGVNRSATVVIAYLMKHEGMTLKQAWEHVRTRRPVVAPVAEYMKQLREYEQTLYGRVTLEEQSTAMPLSLSQRIDAWRDLKMNKNGSLPVVLSSPHKSDESDSEDGPGSHRVDKRAHTSPIVRPKNPQDACSTSGEDGDDSSDLSTSSSTTQKP